jgi:hypothetical protein
MADKLNIPEELKDTHHRLIELLPVKPREDRKIQKATLVFLKFGGETLARHSIEIQKIRHREEALLKKRRQDEEALEETLASDDDEFTVDGLPVTGALDDSGAEEDDDDDD